MRLEHGVDIVQPPGIGIPSIADMDAHQTIVAAALAAKSSAETPKKARSEVRSEAMRREISELVGQRWSLLILRDAMFRNFARFSQFQETWEPP